MTDPIFIIRVIGITLIVAFIIFLIEKIWPIIEVYLDYWLYNDEDEDDG